MYKEGYKRTDGRTSSHEWATASNSCTQAFQSLRLSAAWTSNAQDSLKEEALSNQHLQLR